MNFEPFNKNKVRDASKRFFDVLISFSALIALAPVMASIWLVVRCSGSPAIFSHVRVGRHGHTFKCYKFRSMVNNSDLTLKRHLSQNKSAREEWKRDRKLKDDPRITLLGKYLRKTSLDELPQIINVLKGEMSLVGPRPVPLEELNDKYAKNKRHYLKNKPGITGYWQVSGRSDIEYNKRICMDRLYSMKSSALLDFIIILKTPLAVLSKKGSY